MKQFRVGFTHSESKGMRLTEIISAESAQYARMQVQGKYNGVKILSFTEV